MATPAEVAEADRRSRAIGAYDRAVQARQMGLPSVTLDVVDRLYREIDTPSVVVGEEPTAGGANGGHQVD